MALRIAREPRDPDEGRIAQGARTLAGVAITPDTAVTVSAVWACLRYLSQTVAVLPWHAMLDGPRGPEVRSSNPVDYLIYKRPNPEWSSFQFRETLTHWALRWGNWAVAKIVEVLFNTSHLSDVGCTYRVLTRQTVERIESKFDRSLTVNQIP